MRKASRPRDTLKFLEFIIYLLFLFGPLTGNIILVLFHVLFDEFSVLPPEIHIAIPVFMFPFAITHLFSGAVSDLKGRFLILITGLIIFGISMLLEALSVSLEMYAIANLLGGIGFGLII